MKNCVKYRVKKSVKYCVKYYVGLRETAWDCVGLRAELFSADEDPHDDKQDQ